MIDVIIPSKGKKHVLACIESLRHIPIGIRLLLVLDGNSWAEAVNIGLKESRNDVLLMDDDVRILPETFSRFEGYSGLADIFGFKLLYGNSLIQHAGGFVKNGQIGHLGHGQANNGKYSKPYYTCHVTASLMYIKRYVIEDIGIMAEDYPGFQFEDVDFNFRALKGGYRILYVPDSAVHLESHTKSNIPAFRDGLADNYEEIKRRYLTDVDFLKTVEGYPEPL